jgi:hypothetical protein
MAVKRILIVLGTGQRVSIKTREFRQLAGTIGTIGSDKVMLQDHAREVQVPYTEVVELRKAGGKTGPVIIAVVAAAVVIPILVYYLAVSMNEG